MLLCKQSNKTFFFFFLSLDQACGKSFERDLVSSAALVTFVFISSTRESSEQLFISLHMQWEYMWREWTSNFWDQCYLMGLKQIPLGPCAPSWCGPRCRDQRWYADSWPLIRIQNPAFNAVRFNVQPLYTSKNHTVKSVPSWDNDMPKWRHPESLYCWWINPSSTPSHLIRLRLWPKRAGTSYHVWSEQ